MKNNSNLLLEAQNGKLSNLTSIGGSHKLNSEAASDYKKMVDAAKNDGISWTITDSYRPYDIQDKIFDWDYFNKTGKKRKKGTSGTPVAYPGTSNHGWGSAVDLGVKYGDDAHTWLVDNASKFGFSNPFRNPRTEPWHWEHLSSAKKLKSGSEPVKEIPTDLDDEKKDDDFNVSDKKTEDKKDDERKIDLFGFSALDPFIAMARGNKDEIAKELKNLTTPFGLTESVNEDVVRIKEIMKKVL
jgi:hypothetical protein